MEVSKNPEKEDTTPLPEQGTTLGTILVVPYETDDNTMSQVKVLFAAIIDCLYARSASVESPIEQNLLSGAIQQTLLAQLTAAHALELSQTVQPENPDEVPEKEQEPEQADNLDDLADLGSIP